MEYQEQIMIDAANKLKNANDELEMSMYGRIYTNSYSTVTSYNPYSDLEKEMKRYSNLR